VALRLVINQLRRGRRRAASLLRLGPPWPPASADALAVDAALRTLRIRGRHALARQLAEPDLEVTIAMRTLLNALRSWRRLRAGAAPSNRRS
jgi:hypothetical protein